MSCCQLHLPAAFMFTGTWTRQRYEDLPRLTREGASRPAMTEGRSWRAGAWAAAVSPAASRAARMLALAAAP